MRRLLFNIEGLFNYAMHAIVQRDIIRGNKSQYNRVRLAGYRENIEQLDYNQQGLTYYWLVNHILDLHKVR